jgi:hypothetical protein
MFLEGGGVEAASESIDEPHHSKRIQIKKQRHSRPRPSGLVIDLAGTHTGAVVVEFSIT